jgi:glycine dehydrogenase
MVEPTESESREELDRFCGAMISIRREIQEVIDGAVEAANSALHNAPHTAAEATADSWDHPYTRTQAVYPLPFVRDRKYWSPVARIDNSYGDRHIMCSCPPIEAYADDAGD